MFILKKLVSRMLFPIPLTLLALGLGIVLLFGKRKRAGMAFVILSFLMLLAMSTMSFPSALLRPLEREYPQLDLNNPLLGQASLIVVLSGGHNSDPDIPLTSRLSEPSLVRLMEGIRIYNAMGDATLFLTGGTVCDPVPEAQVMADMAQEFGVSAADIIMETASKDTRMQAAEVKSIVGAAPFVLVTSASHMPRSMKLFKEQGLTPIPAPTNFLIKESYSGCPWHIYPSVQELRIMERAIYEYLGHAWLTIQGFFGKKSETPPAPAS